MTKTTIRALSLPLLMLVLAFALICTIAEAHALLVSSSPKNNAVLKAAPKQIVLRFDARIEKSVTKVTLYKGRGDKLKLPVASHGYSGGRPDELIIPMPKLKPGSYRLEYRVLATDGHLTPGLIRFAISGGKPT